MVSNNVVLLQAETLDPVSMLDDRCTAAALSNGLHRIATRAYRLIRDGQSLPVSHSQRAHWFGITPKFYSRNCAGYDLAITIAVEVAREVARAVSLPPGQTPPPGQTTTPPEKPAQPQASKGIEPDTKGSPLYTRVGFIKPENLFIKPGDDEKIQTDQAGLEDTFRMIVHSRKRHGIKLDCQLDRAGNVTLKAVKARVITFCQGSRSKVAGFWDRLMAYAKAYRLPDIRAVLTRWNDLEPLVKADLGIGGRQGWRGAQRPAGVVTRVDFHASHVAQPVQRVDTTPRPRTRTIDDNVLAMRAALRARRAA